MKEQVKMEDPTDETVRKAEMTIKVIAALANGETGEMAKIAMLALCIIADEIELSGQIKGESSLVSVTQVKKEIH